METEKMYYAVKRDKRKFQQIFLKYELKPIK